MSDAPSRKPRPARLPEIEAPGKPTPVRQLVDPGASATPSAAYAQPSGPAPAEADDSEVALEADGTTWRVRVLGRSGSSGTRSPPLLLLGFWDDDERDTEHAREALVVARALSGLSQSRLRRALAASTPPPLPDRKPAFFEGASAGRRGAGSRRDS